jgi:hypothetical protein
MVGRLDKVRCATLKKIAALGLDEKDFFANERRPGALRHKDALCNLDTTCNFQRFIVMPSGGQTVPK